MTTSNSANKDFCNVPEPTLRRLPWYLSNVKLMKTRGERFVSSTALARATGIDASQVAKDLSFVNISGRTRIGYGVDEMIDALDEFLWSKEMHKAFIFGVGSLGAALLSDTGLKHYGLDIVGAFDVSDKVVGKNINGICVRHIDELKEAIRACEDVQIGVLTVPIEVAEDVTRIMVDSGIKAIWNFTPFRIRVPENIVVQNTSLYAHLAVMFNRLNLNNKR